MKLLLSILICATAFFANAQFRAIGLAKGQQCQNNLKQIGLSLDMFEADHGTFPDSLKQMGNNISKQICFCPNAKNGKKEYIYLGNIGRNANAPVVIDRIGNHPNEINVLYRNGSVRTIRHTSTNYKGLLSHFKGLSKQDSAILAGKLKDLDAGK